MFPANISKMADRSAILAIVMEELANDDFSTFFQRNANLLQNELLLYEDETEPSARIEGFVEEIVPLYSMVDFKSHFRMTRASFKDLCEVLAPFMIERTLTVEKKILATLWLLCNQESYRSVADRFDMSKGTLHITVVKTARAISGLMKDYITFPSSLQDMESKAAGFRERCGFPGVVGALDGTHINIPAPTSEHRASYINRKGQSSMVLQVISDSSLKFLDIYTGWPGSVHDARVFRNSPVAQKVEELPAGHHLLGDSAYPLMSGLLVPFRDDGHLSVVQKKFNKCHSSTRVEVERAIGLLKCRFRRLKYLDMLLEREIPSVIASCCVLHNFILEKEGEPDIDVEDIAEEELGEQYRAGIVNEGASEKRMNIAHLLL